MNAITLWLVYSREICDGFLFGGPFLLQFVCLIDICSIKV